MGRQVLGLEGFGARDSADRRSYWSLRLLQWRYMVVRARDSQRRSASVDHNLQGLICVSLAFIVLNFYQNFVCEVICLNLILWYDMLNELC